MSAARKPELTATQRRRVEQAREAADKNVVDIAADCDRIDPDNLAMVHGYVLGVTRAQVRELLQIIDELTGGAR